MKAVIIVNLEMLNIEHRRFPTSAKTVCTDETYADTNVADDYC